MAKYKFKVLRDHLTPQQYPLGVTYWRLGFISSTDGDIYTLVIDTVDPAVIHTYWPAAWKIELYHNDPLHCKLYAKRTPTGLEERCMRVHFLNPLGSPFPVNPPYPNQLRQRASYDPNMTLWTACVDSIDQLREHFPQAWDIDVISEGLYL